MTKNQHVNEERTVVCPGCGDEKLARGVHLHIMRSNDEDHGPQGEIPDEFDLDNLDDAGTAEVSMDYPDRRDTEQVARLCPYCEKPFRGKHGVLIHLGQVRGRKDHPETYPDDLDPDEFTIVHLDEHENIVEVVDEGTVLPSTKRRREKEQQEELPEKVKEYIEELRAKGKEEEAELAKEKLLGD